MVEGSSSNAAATSEEKPKAADPKQDNNNNNNMNQEGASPANGGDNSASVGATNKVDTKTGGGGDAMEVDEPATSSTMTTSAEADTKPAISDGNSQPKKTATLPSSPSKPQQSTMTKARGIIAALESSVDAEPSKPTTAAAAIDGKKKKKDKDEKKRSGKKKDKDGKKGKDKVKKKKVRTHYILIASLLVSASK